MKVQKRSGRYAPWGRIAQLVILSAAMLLSVSCGKDEDETKKDDKDKDKSEVVGESVVINGVTWAASNVDASGTFAATPESTGRYYQWNRKKAWATTGSVTEWDGTPSTGTKWEADNDPSPKGWHIPTTAELETLLDAAKVNNVWTTSNGVNGRLFTDIATGATLFLPAAGDRSSGLSGALNYVNQRGFYWSNLADGTENANYLDFYNTVIDLKSTLRSFGFLIRCVKNK